MTDTKETAVEWFAYEDNLITIDYLEGKINQLQLIIKKKDLLHKAFELFEQQIRNAYEEGIEAEYQHHVNNEKRISSEEFYKNTYK